MKIVLLPAAYYTDPTYYRVLSSLKREFLASGEQVDVVSKRISSGIGFQLDAKAGEISAAPTRKALSRLLGAETVLNFHFSGRLHAWHAPLLLSAPASTAKLVVTFQDYRHPDLPLPTKAAYKELHTILKKAARITAVSGFLAGMIRKDFPSVTKKISVIPNGTDIPAPTASATQRGSILTVGRQVPYKGLDLLLFAFAKAVEKGCACKLTVCGTGGDGSLRLLARKLGIADRVKFEGLTAPDKIGSKMRNCLFFATTPRWESFGMAALEAMAAGKAVLASRRGGLTEFARNGHNALLVDPEAPDEVSSAILKLYSDKPFRSALERKAVATARAHSWQKVAAKYLQVYR